MEKKKRILLASDLADDLRSEREAQQAGDQNDSQDNRGMHIQKRIDRSQYRQWERNLRSKMKAWVK